MTAKKLARQKVNIRSLRVWHPQWTWTAERVPANLCRPPISWKYSGTRGDERVVIYASKYRGEVQRWDAVRGGWFYAGPYDMWSAKEDKA